MCVSGPYESVGGLCDAIASADTLKLLMMEVSRACCSLNVVMVMLPSIERLRRLDCSSDALADNSCEC